MNILKKALIKFLGRRKPVVYFGGRYYVYDRETDSYNKSYVRKRVAEFKAAQNNLDYWKTEDVRNAKRKKR